MEQTFTEPIVARRSIRRYAWGLLAGIGIGIGSHLLGMSRGMSFTLGLVSVAGPAAFEFLRAVLGQGEVLRIDAAGIIDHRQHSILIPWDQIDSAEKRRGRLRVRVREPAALELKKTLWRRMNQPFGQDPEIATLFVRLANLDVPADRIVGAVRHRISVQE